MPLDTNYSAVQLATIVRACAPRVLFANARLAQLARDASAGIPATVVADIRMPQSIGSPGSGDLDGGAGHDPAVILYTAGTTADAKGVVLTHDNLLAARDAACQVVAVEQNDRVLGGLPLFAPLGQLANLLLPCAVGARILFLETTNSNELMRALSEQRITVVTCAPKLFDLLHQRVLRRDPSGMWRTLMFHGRLALNFHSRQLGMNLGPLLFARSRAGMGRHMRLFVTSGSKFDPAVGRDLYALGFTILRAYGLTETSGVATLRARMMPTWTRWAGRCRDSRSRCCPPRIQTLTAKSRFAVRSSCGVTTTGPTPRRQSMRDGWLLTGDLGRMDETGRLSITGRKNDVIVLAAGETIDPLEIEAAYLQSLFVQEICVLGFPREDGPTAESLYAVVVPNLDLLRERRIVNAGDLLRFELEGLSIHLPYHKRVTGYEIWFEPLPRTTTGTVKRHEVARRVCERRRADAGFDRDDAAFDADDAHARRAVAVIARRAVGKRIAPESNLELDLGLDSIQRVELLSEIERNLGGRIPEGQEHEVFTVRQLIDATRAGAQHASAASADSWADIFRDLPPPDDPLLRGLLQPRPIAARVFFLAPQLLRLLLLPRICATGLNHLPAQGPFIISPNHQGYLDPFIICSALPFELFRQLFFVGAAEYFETPLMAWIARKGNCIPVDPDANLVSALKAGAFGLAHGRVLMLFPEGERSIDGTVKHFKKGAPVLARHLAVPVVPVAIRGAYEVWPRNRRINWGLMFPWRRHRIRVAFGAPLRFADFADYESAAAELRSRVAAMWNELG